MSKTPKITRHQLKVGDFIAFDTPAQDVDTPDSRVWLRITGVVFEDGYRGYKVAFPNGEEMYRTIRANSVGSFKLAADFHADENLAGVPESESWLHDKPVETEPAITFADLKRAEARAYQAGWQDGAEWAREIHQQRFIERKRSLQAV